MLFALKLNERVYVFKVEVYLSKLWKICFIIYSVFLLKRYVPFHEVSAHVSLTYTLALAATFGAAMTIVYLVNMGRKLAMQRADATECLAEVGNVLVRHIDTMLKVFVNSTHKEVYLFLVGLALVMLWFSVIILITAQVFVWKDVHFLAVLQSNYCDASIVVDVVDLGVVKDTYAKAVD